MLNKNVEKAINDQIVAELYSAYMYLSMSAYFESENLDGFSQWMQAQALEELYHAMKFYNYVNERGGRVILGPVEQPESVWDSPIAVFKATYDHEVKVTGLIHNLVDIARKENDKATESFLSWYVDEQVEEEDTADRILGKLTMIKDAPGALFMMNNELGQRAPAWPAAEEDE